MPHALRNRASSAGVWIDAQPVYSKQAAAIRMARIGFVIWYIQGDYLTRYHERHHCHEGRFHKIGENY